MLAKIRIADGTNLPNFQKGEPFHQRKTFPHPTNEASPEEGFIIDRLFEFERTKIRLMMVNGMLVPLYYAKRIVNQLNLPKESINQSIMETDHKIILGMLFFLSTMVVIQICSLEYFHLGRHAIHFRSGVHSQVYASSLNRMQPSMIGGDSSKTKSKGEGKEGKGGVGESDSKEEEVEGGGDRLRSLEEILHSAGVEVTDELRLQLPPKEDVISMYGSEPNIVGLDRCETFQKTVVKGDGFIAPAGMFNTVSTHNIK